MRKILPKIILILIVAILWIICCYTRTMFGNKKPDAPRPLNDSGRSLISETFSLEGTLRTSGAIDIAGLIKGRSLYKRFNYKRNRISYWSCRNRQN